MSAKHPDELGIITAIVMTIMTVVFIPPWAVWSLVRRFRRVTLRDRLWQQVIHPRR